MMTGALAVGMAAGTACLGMPAGNASVRAVPNCTTADLSAKATASGAGMSQPYTLITVTNTSGSACRLKGYPTITGATTKKGRASIAAGPGLIQGPIIKVRLIRLAPGGHAYFGLGTATAYDPPIVTLTSVGVATSAGAGSINVKIDQQATAPKGEPIPVSVTPYAPGVGTGQG